MTLLRIPRLSTVEKVVAFTDCSINSEYKVIKALSDKAVGRGIKHNIVLMIDVGDLREGVLPEDAAEAAENIVQLPGVTLSGIGTNMGCYGGILPTAHNLNLLLEIKADIERKAGIELEVVSGGGTSSLKLVEDGCMPKGINQLRIGEGILLGTDTTHGYGAVASSRRLSARMKSLRLRRNPPYPSALRVMILLEKGRYLSTGDSENARLWRWADRM